MKKSVVAEWRRYEDRYRLMGSVCLLCKENFFPRVTHCVRCGSSDVRDRLFLREGEIYSFSKIHVSPEQFQKQVPYYVALIKLDNGPVISSQIVDVGSEKLFVGMRVYAVFRKVSGTGEQALTYGIKFRLTKK
ncbi:Zn-ribbon domain-containing OB-fold protein [Patescibacteria group bacterium]|nr:Zn-ribbon domain-containing OB-fold protein [Patescibacteria group bacterium]